MLLTDIAIRAIRAPEQGQCDYWDDALPGFGIRVSKGGSKTFVLLLRGNRRSIGRYPLISLAEARKQAKKLLAQKELGRTFVPIAFKDALERYIETHVKQHNKPSTAYEAERILRKHFSFGPRPLDSISSADLMDIVDALAPSAANHAFAHARSFFRWAVRRHYLDRHPLEAIPRPHKDVPRERVLQDPELVAIWRAAQNFPFPYGHIIALLVLTGQRAGEITKLKHSYIRSGLITFPPEIVKNNQSHTIPYGTITEQVLDSIPKKTEYLFPSKSKLSFFDGHNKAKARFDAACPLPHWTLHDIRRTFSTIHARIGTPPHVTEALLNHKAGELTPIAKIYNRHSYLPQMRVAMEHYDAELTALFAS